MTHRLRLPISSIFCLSLGLFMSILAGCGTTGVAAPLPDLVEGLTLSELEAIQNDERLTDDEKREQIREAIDAPDTDAGDRLVEFLLTLTVP